MISRGGGGGAKRFWTHANHEPGFRARIRKLLGFRCSLMLSEPYFKYSDTKWNKNHKNDQNLGRGGGWEGAHQSPPIRPCFSLVLWSLVNLD